MMLIKKPFFILLPLTLFLCHAFTPNVKPQKETHKAWTLKEAQLNIEGLVTTDGKPCKATVEIHSNFLHHRTILTLQTDSLFGQFFATLAPGDDYDIVVKTTQFPQQVLSLSTRGLDSNFTLPVFADFISPAYDKKLTELKRTVDKVKAKSNKYSEAKFAKLFGEAQRAELHYKVQIAAYRFFENFNYNNVKGLPRIIRKTDSDYITRFTMGDYPTYNEAVALMKKARQCDLKEAFVIAFYKGERLLPSELYAKLISNQL